MVPGSTGTMHNIKQHLTQTATHGFMHLFFTMVLNGGRARLMPSVETQLALYKPVMLKNQTARLSPGWIRATVRWKTGMVRIPDITCVSLLILRSMHNTISRYNPGVTSATRKFY